MTRTPFQGVATVVRFNYHFYAIAACAIAVLGSLAPFAPPTYAVVLLVLAIGIFLATTLSLTATFLAYDSSALYRLDWLATHLPTRGLAANIHAGFDETTPLLRHRFPGLTWRGLDFYNPAKHTELSIRRARRAHPPSSETVHIATTALPLPDASLDCATLLLAAHEIRDPAERLAFFRELNRVLTPDGVVIVTEHLRDTANILAYTFGAWHFHPPAAWHATFADAGFALSEVFRPAPLITTFVLKKNGNAA